ncbi:hypothetical protein SHIRM173S_01050 [Streptomyces hirsutus]
MGEPHRAATGTRKGEAGRALYARPAGLPFSLFTLSLRTGSALSLRTGSRGPTVTAC